MIELNGKVKELESLDKLKELTLLDINGSENTTGNELAPKGDEQGQEGSGEVQEEDD